MLKITSILLGLSASLAFSQARADVVIKPVTVKYGSLNVVGGSNPGSYYALDSYSVSIVSTGSKSEDTGSVADAQPLNKPLKLRVGTYLVSFANTSAQFDVKEGATTTVKLQKITALPMDGATEVKLYNSDLYDPSCNDSDNDSNSLVGDFLRTHSVVTGKTCHSEFSIFQLPHDVCDNQYGTANEPWSKAVYYVLPGNYMLHYVLKDGTIHSENSIVVK